MAKQYYRRTEPDKPQELPPQADKKTEHDIIMSNFRYLFDKINQLENEIFELKNQ